MNLINRIFSSNNDNYILAKNSLSRVKNKLSDLIDNFPDVTIPEIIYVEKKWSELPQSVGVSVLGLDVEENFKTFLTHYNQKGYILPHEHRNDFELNKIIKGSISNKLTGERFETGDTFVIDKNERHYLSANEESFVYCVITPDEDYLEVPQIKPNVLKAFNLVQPGL